MDSETTNNQAINPENIQPNSYAIDRLLGGGRVFVGGITGGTATVYYVENNNVFEKQYPLILLKKLPAEPIPIFVNRTYLDL